MTLKQILEASKHITFDGTNVDELTSKLSDFTLSQEENGKLSIEIDGKLVTIFKGDTIEYSDKKIKIVKPII